jgi:hypothetical protein
MRFMILVERLRWLVGGSLGEGPQGEIERLLTFPTRQGSATGPPAFGVGQAGQSLARSYFRTSRDD